MTSIVPEPIEQYAHDHTSPRGPLFDELRERTYGSMKSPHMQVGRVEGTFLKTLCAISNAKRVLEIGTFTGFSALCMAEALPEDGEIVTCDIDPEAVAIARSFFERSPHGKKITARLGPALDTIATLEGPFDLVFLDADKERYVEYYERTLPLLRAGGLLVADNTLWSGRVLAPSADTDRAIVAFNRRVADDPRVENVLVSVRDGMMLARKL